MRHSCVTCTPGGIRPRLLLIPKHNRCLQIGRKGKVLPEPCTVAAFRRRPAPAGDQGHSRETLSLLELESLQRFLIGRERFTRKCQRRTHFVKGDPWILGAR